MRLDNKMQTTQVIGDKTDSCTSQYQQGFHLTKIN